MDERDRFLTTVNISTDYSEHSTEYSEYSTDYSEWFTDYSEHEHPLRPCVVRPATIGDLLGSIFDLFMISYWDLVYV